MIETDTGAGETLPPAPEQESEKVVGDVRAPEG
jgi:hypothetical protein